jgi:hypothetical protein
MGLLKKTHKILLLLLIFKKSVEKYCRLFVTIARRVRGAGQLQQTGGETLLHG